MPLTIREREQCHRSLHTVRGLCRVPTNLGVLACITVFAIVLGTSAAVSYRSTIRLALQSCPTEIAWDCFTTPPS
jgi:hypothetical protein